MVCFRPGGRTVAVSYDATLLQAAQEASLPVGSSCRGEGVCGWCRVTVLEGAKNLDDPDARELEVLRRVEAGESERLACVARVRGAVTITASYW